MDLRVMDAKAKEEGAGGLSLGKRKCLQIHLGAKLGSHSLSI